MSFNFFEKNPNIKYHVQRFDLQDESDRMLYERIHQNSEVDKKNGWEIKEEESVTDKFANVFRILKWTQPKVGDNNGREQ